MRFISFWHFVAGVGWFLAAVLPASALHGEGTLTFRPGTLAQAVDQSPVESPTPTLATPPEQPVAPRATTTMTVRPIPRSIAPVYAQPGFEPQVTNQTRAALNFYGGYSARATLSQLPRRAPIQHSAPQPARRQGKPFEQVQSDPTISPYLNLDRDDDDNESLPNYFAFVRPQLDQLEANRMQQREIQQLRGQVHGMSSTVAGPTYQGGVIPGTGTAARYMDTAQFYGGWRR